MLIMKRYCVIDKKNVYHLYNSDLKTCNKTLLAIMKRLKESPETNFLIIFCVAGHGLNYQGL